MSMRPKFFTIPAALLFSLLGISPVLAEGSYDGQWEGSMKCGGTGSYPGFTRPISMTISGDSVSAWGIGTQTSGKIQIADTLFSDPGDITIRGGYENGKKQYSFSGEYGETIKLKGRRGPRLCIIALTKREIAVAEVQPDQKRLRRAINHGDLAEVKSLIEHGIDVNQPSAGGRLPLVQAALLGQREIVVALIAAGADLESAWAALPATAKAGNREAVAVIRGALRQPETTSETPETSTATKEAEPQLSAQAEERSKLDEQRQADIANGKAAERLLDTESKKMIQQALKDLGFLKGPVDGVFGSGTRKAIQAYEISTNDTPTGYLTASEAAELKKRGEESFALAQAEKQRKAEEEALRREEGERKGEEEKAIAATPTDAAGEQEGIPAAADATAADKEQGSGSDKFAVWRTDPATAFLFEGYDSDLILLFNDTGQAANGVRNLSGDILFENNEVAACGLSQVDLSPDFRTYTGETLQTEKNLSGFGDPAGSYDPCGPLERLRSDLLVFSRAAFLNRDIGTIAPWLSAIQQNQLSVFHVSSFEAFQALEKEKLEAAKTVADAVRAGAIEGYGLLIADNGSTIFCAETSTEEDVVTALVDRINGTLPPGLRQQPVAVSFGSRDDSFIALKRRKCGFFFGNAQALKAIDGGLTRDRHDSRFHHVWFEEPGPVVTEVRAAAREEAERLEAASQEQHDATASNEAAAVRTAPTIGETAEATAKSSTNEPATLPAAADDTAAGASSANAARQASFDCAKAAAPVELLICGDDEMAALDREMVQLYKSYRSTLSADGREDLLRQQRRWLKDRLAECNIPAKGTFSPEGRVKARDCLANQYAVRNNGFIRALGGPQAANPDEELESSNSEQAETNAKPADPDAPVSQEQNDGVPDGGTVRAGVTPRKNETEAAAINSAGNAKGIWGTEVIAGSDVGHWVGEILITSCLYESMDIVFGGAPKDLKELKESAFGLAVKKLNDLNASSVLSEEGIGNLLEAMSYHLKTQIPVGRVTASDLAKNCASLIRSREELKLMIGEHLVHHGYEDSFFTVGLATRKQEFAAEVEKQQKTRSAVENLAIKCGPSLDCSDRRAVATAFARLGTKFHNDGNPFADNCFAAMREIKNLNKDLWASIPDYEVFLESRIFSCNQGLNL